MWRWPQGREQTSPYPYVVVIVENNNLHGGDACPGRDLTTSVARRLFRDLTSTTAPQILRAAAVLTLNSIAASTTEEEAIELGHTGYIYIYFLLAEKA